MAAGGAFAFAPLGASPSVANANEMVDQINTKADGENIKYAPSALGLDPENDPVIYTTESGLEIKFGGAATVIGGGTESPTINNPNLTGFLYVTMGVYSYAPVNWIIVAKSSTGSFLTKSLGHNFSYQKLSVWQGQTAKTSSHNNFFTNTYEITTPAGLAVKNDNLLNDITARGLYYNIPDSFSSATNVVEKSDLPSDSIYCISECVFGSSSWSSSDSGGSNNLNSSVANRFSNMGLTAEQLALMTTQRAPSYNGTYGVATYFTTNETRIAYSIGTTTAATYWTNQGYGSYTAYCFQASGALYGNGESYCGRDDVNRGVRLACVISLA